jgi:hypothetical protein
MGSKDVGRAGDLELLSLDWDCSTPNAEVPIYAVALHCPV